MHEQIDILVGQMTDRYAFCRHHHYIVRQSQTNLSDFEQIDQVLTHFFGDAQLDQRISLGTFSDYL